MNHDVRGDIKRARSQQMHAIAARMKAKHLARFVGDTRPVLWEGTARPADRSAIWSGYTDNYLRVETVTAAGVDLENRILPTTLISTTGSPPDLLSGQTAIHSHQPIHLQGDRPVAPHTLPSDHD